MVQKWRKIIERFQATFKYTDAQHSYSLCTVWKLNPTVAIRNIRIICTKYDKGTITRCKDINKVKIKPPHFFAWLL